jgi:mannose/fructose/N-acetylgalactosamine-specific phosphotransferase system component IIC
MDTTVAWQMMLSQPLVCGTLAGLLVGFPEAGIFIGVVLQMLWSGSMPVGARPMPDAPVGTICGVWLAAVLLGGEQTVSNSFSQLAGLMAALCVALAGRWTISWERELSGKLVRRLRARLSSGATINPGATQALGVTMAFCRGYLLCMVAAVVFTFLAPLLTAAREVAERDYRLVVLVIEGLAIGVLFPVFVRGAKGRLPAFAGGVALALLLRHLAS